jgi:hypothetical protein
VASLANHFIPFMNGQRSHSRFNARTAAHADGDGFAPFRVSFLARIRIEPRPPLPPKLRVVACHFPRFAPNALLKRMLFVGSASISVTSFETRIFFRHVAFLALFFLLLIMVYSKQTCLCNQIGISRPSR